MNSVDHLIISSTVDYSTDYICFELQKRDANYLRINRDQFNENQYTYDLRKGCMYVESEDEIVTVNKDALRSILFRAPVFIRSNKNYCVEDQLYRSQWSSFIRNLTVFTDAKWINHPQKIFQAENKLFQLEQAKSCGLVVPDTIVANNTKSIEANKLYAVKSLDTALYYDNNQELFTYTIVISGDELMKSSLKDAPVIIQECLTDKTDIRVTAIGSKLFATEITMNGRGIDGDWRKNPKDKLCYKPIQLPTEIENKLLVLMKKMELTFGGIDLAYAYGTYFFIEVNPTGEWCWLEKPTGYPLAESIVEYMSNEKE